MKTILILIILNFSIFGTTEYLAKNNITKELFIFEDGRIVKYDGLFWHSVQGEENEVMKQEILLLKKGYKYTKYPYKIDLFLFILIVILFFIIKKLHNLKLIKKE